MKTTFTIQSEEAEVEQLLDALRALLTHMQGKQVEIAISELSDTNTLYQDKTLSASIKQTPEVQFSPDDIAHMNRLFEAENFEAVSSFIEQHKRK
ncbi:MAG: hypothetical protein KF690_08785 [Bacteroidetes bacterium]|nr:hypothetical protein [Bacteroidota bacterium]